MYENVGQKIKNLTTILVVIMMILSLVGGISAMVLDEDMIIPGLLLAGVGCFVSWIGGLAMYAYGDIADNIQTINEQLTSMNGGSTAASPNYQHSQPTPQNPTYTYAPQSTAAAGESWVCIQCGTQNIMKRSYCIQCNTSRDWSQAKRNKR